MGWKGESRRHSLSRKGIRTNINKDQRLSVRNFVARGEKDKTFHTKIGNHGAFNLVGYYEKNKGETYDGHFTIKLFLGDLKWNIDKDMFEDLKSELGRKANFLVHPYFSQNTATYLYIKEEDIDEIWNKTVKILDKKLKEKRG